MYSYWVCRSSGGAERRIFCSSNLLAFHWMQSVFDWFSFVIERQRSSRSWFAIPLFLHLGHKQRTKNCINRHVITLALNDEVHSDKRGNGIYATFADVFEFLSLSEFSSSSSESVASFLLQCCCTAIGGPTRESGQVARALAHTSHLWAFQKARRGQQQHQQQQLSTLPHTTQAQLCCVRWHGQLTSAIQQLLSQLHG